MYNFLMKTLARFVQERREQVGLSVTGLAKRSNVDAEIIEEIEDEPTHTYFNHYRNVNAFIDAGSVESAEDVNVEKTELSLEEICKRYVVMFRIYNEDAYISNYLFKYRIRKLKYYDFIIKTLDKS